MLKDSFGSDSGSITTSPPVSPSTTYTSSPLSPPTTSTRPSSPQPSRIHSQPRSLDLWSQTWGLRDVDAIFNTHDLPQVLQLKGHVDKTEISYACESREIVACEVEIAERRFRQLVLMARLHHLRLLEAQSNLQCLSEKVDMAIDNAAKEVQHAMHADNPAQSMHVRTAHHLPDEMPPQQHLPIPSKLRISNREPIELIVACEGALDVA